LTSKDDPRLALLTGAAIKLMAEAGADAAVLGHFAVHYPSIAAAQLEPPPPPLPPQEIDLEALVRTTVQAVLGSTISGRAGPQGDDHGRSTKTKRGRGVELVKRNVLVGGKRTSISLSADLYRQVVEADGADQAEKLVQGFVDQKPSSEQNRSAWVEAQITQHLVLNQVSTFPTSAH
jgi:hypothetical protein